MAQDRLGGLTQSFKWQNAQNEVLKYPSGDGKTTQ